MSTQPDPQTLIRSSEGYEELRRRYFNARVPDVKPVEIWSPSTTADVVAAVKSANKKGLKVGVRSGGHLFPCLSLVQNGILIDTKNLNKNFDYDQATKMISFSPGHTVLELSDQLKPLKRFFPAGHSRSVGMGGFYLAGGQGCFLRGWGYTSDTWITQIEVVTASGQVVVANKKQNADLFWAAPGSGQGFFGVLTRIWGRTIAAQKLFDTTIILDSTDVFKSLLRWALETADKVPEYGSDIFMATFYADKDAPGDGEASQAKRVFLALNQTIHVNSIDQAKILASPWDSLPSEFEPFVITRVPMQERTWEELWDLQESFQPHGQGERYKVDSILADPEVSYEKIVDKITPALLDLPTRKSTGTIVFLDYFPDEADQALSLPQKLSVTTMAIWKDPARDVAMDKWMYDAYKEAEKVGRGQYVADYDAEQRPTKIMSDTALKRWFQIRAKWDPAETFIGHRSFEKSQNIDLKL
ncbi:hypothetical protein DL95DRAFT_500403 [Leptodontidium sp. 2 PMI_412]|nr:hypothetical protein DL95DRAFT_500403 [Leptodontidium sp. 2 PMI_412]